MESLQKISYGNSNITKEILKENTTIITKKKQPRKLVINEALLIKNPLESMCSFKVSITYSDCSN